MKVRLITSLGLVGLLLAGGCARNPVSGRPDAVLMTEKSEIEQGREAAEEIAKYIGFIDDPGLAKYVAEIGTRLAAQSPRQNLVHHFQVVEMTDVNAFALPGGYIYVSRGLMALLNSEDELATVLGHEMGHVAARHSVTRQAASAPMIPVRIAAGLGGAAASIVSPKLGQVIAATGTLPGGLALAAYSREQERDADRLGQQFAAESGWNPMALSSFMHTLGLATELEGDAGSSFFSSHPTSPERSKDTGEFAKSLTVVEAAPVARDHREFLERIEGILVGDPASGGVFVDDRFLQPDMSFGLRFPAEWEKTNSDAAVQARDPEDDSSVTLMLASGQTDPMTAAQEAVKGHRLAKSLRRFVLNDLGAVEAEVENPTGRNTRAYVVWIASDGIVYQIAGVSPEKRWNAMEPLFRETAESFHVLGDEERTEVTENRLRVVEARGEETLSELIERTDSQWSLEKTALANALEGDPVLETGQPIKIVRKEPYLGQ